MVLAEKLLLLCGCLWAATTSQLISRKYRFYSVSVQFQAKHFPYKENSCKDKKQVMVKLHSNFQASVKSDPVKGHDYIHQRSEVLHARQDRSIL